MSAPTRPGRLPSSGDPDDAVRPEGGGPPQPPPARALASSAAVMASGTLVSRLLGLLRNALLVAVVGAVLGIADAWSVANKLPNIISMLLAGGILNAVLVPQVVRALRRPDGGTEYVNRLLTIAGAFLLGLTVLLTAGATVLVRLYASQWDAEWVAVGVAIAYWCLPQLFFYGIYTLLGQVLNARSVFGPYMWAPAANNVVAIAGLVVFLVVFGPLPDGGLPASAWTGDRIMLLAGTATLGVVVQALVLIVPLHRSGFRYRPVWGLKNSGLGAASQVAKWAFAALAVGQLGYLAVSNLAAAAGAVGERTRSVVAGNFAYDNAFLVFMLPQSLITVSLVTAMFTRLSSHAAAGQGARVRDDLSTGLRTLAVFTVFATAALAVLAIPVVQGVMLGSRSFEEYRAVAAVLVAMVFGIAPIAGWTMVQRVFFAYEDTRTLFRIQVPMAGILVLGCLISWLTLPAQWWVVGAGAATTASNVVGAVVGYLATRTKIPSLDGARVLRTHLRLLLAILPPALAGWGLLHLWGVQTGFLGALLRVVVLGTFMLVGYLLLLRLLKVSELGSLLVRLRGPLGGLARRLPGPLRSVLGRTMATDSVPEPMTGGPMATGASTALVVGDTLAGRYLLEVELTPAADDTRCWSARDTGLDRPVQVLLLDGPHTQGVLDAARRAALVQEPRLPRVLRVGSDTGRAFVVTESVGGVTLAQLLSRGPLPPSQARALLGEAAAALETARRRGVHHLALQPGALVRTPAGGVTVLGLAVANALRGSERRTGAAAARADAVALVELLYAALTGTWPGDPAVADGLPMAERTDAGPVPAGDGVDGVPNDLDTLCAVTLGSHDDGPLTPGQLVADLAPWEPVDPAAQPMPRAVPPPPGHGQVAAQVRTSALPAAGAVGAAAAAVPTGGAVVPDDVVPAVTGALPASGVEDPGAVPAASGTAGPAPADAAVPAQDEASAAERHSPNPYDDDMGGWTSTDMPAIRDTSGWAPQPLPATVEPTPFSDLFSDTGSMPAVGHVPASGYAARHERTSETHVRLPAVPGHVTAGGSGAAVPGALAGAAAAGDAAAGADVVAPPEQPGPASASATGVPAGSDVLDAEDAVPEQQAVPEGAVAGEPAPADRGTDEGVPGQLPSDDPGSEALTSDHVAPESPGHETTASGDAAAAVHVDAPPSSADDVVHPDETQTHGGTDMPGSGAADSGVPDSGVADSGAALAGTAAADGIDGGSAPATAEPWWVGPPPTVVADDAVADPRLDIGTTEPDPTDPPAVVPALPALTAPRGWDTPGAPAAPAPQVGALGTPVVGTDAPARAAAGPAAGAAVAGAAAAGAAAARSIGSAARSAARAAGPGLARSKRVFLQASESIGTRAQAMVEGTGRRLEDATGRAGAFVDDVSQEFEAEDVPETERDGRARINPAPIVLLTMIGVLIFALVLAVTTLRNASDAFTPQPLPGASQPADATDEPTDEPSPDPEPTSEPAPESSATAPTIADGITFDPIVDGGENQDQAYFAYDGNPDTTWNSLRYNSPTYGMKPGIGYTVVLEETSTVSRVTLRVNGEGGLVQIRAGDPTQPDQGDVLAEGAMGPEVTFDLSEPIETDSISLWFPELPVSASDGRNRIELAEIQLG